VTERFAAIADVHGNRWALEAVLADIERRGIRDVVNLGDHLFGPLDPDGTARLLMARGFPSVSGNQDRELVEAGDAHSDWLAAMPLTLELQGMLLFHGTPSRDNQYLLETVHPDGVTLASHAEIAERLGPVAQPLLLCGHTHIPRAFMFRGRLIVNPGSVGLQAYEDDTPVPHRMETGSPQARYAVLERHETGWHVDLLSIPYDHESAAQTALRNGRPDWAHRLRTGRPR
jgi:predicted phosphodiesterase